MPGVRDQLGGTVEWDHETEQQKRAELLGFIEAAVGQKDAANEGQSSLAEQILKAFVKTTPPEQEPVVMHLVTMHFDGRGGGKSTKAGNITLNMGTLIDTIAAGALTAIGALQAPITVPFAAIALWNSMWRAAQVDLTENDAAVLYVMWTQRDENNEIAKRRPAGKVQRSHRKGGAPSTYEEGLDTLTRQAARNRNY